MNNRTAWEQEYQSPKFVSLGTDAAQDVKDFVKWLRRKQHVELDHGTLLDLGCGIGKNSFYFEQYGMRVIGYDFSQIAIAKAKEIAKQNQSNAVFEVQSIGEVLPLNDRSITVAIDVMSSHALSTTERATYVSELHRVLNPGGYAFVRTFVLEGDDNAKKLMKQFPGGEPQSYVLPETGMTEHVYFEKELRELYKDFEILHFEKVFGYQRWENRVYKRRYALLYLKKR